MLSRKPISHRDSMDNSVLWTRSIPQISNTLGRQHCDAVIVIAATNVSAGTWQRDSSSLLTSAGCLRAGIPALGRLPQG